MTSGGARLRSGPSPDPDALRRDRPSDAAGWIDLPAAGRPGKAPAWPLSARSRRESMLWTRLWARPQAVEWERLDLTLEVAALVRATVRFEGPQSSGSDGVLMRQLMDSLGLSLGGLNRNRWRIASVSAEAAPAPNPQDARPSARERLRLVVGA